MAATWRPETSGVGCRSDARDWGSNPQVPALPLRPRPDSQTHARIAPTRPGQVWAPGGPAGASGSEREDCGPASPSSSFPSLCDDSQAPERERKLESHSQIRENVKTRIGTEHLSLKLLSLLSKADWTSAVTSRPETLSCPLPLLSPQGLPRCGQGALLLVVPLRHRPTPATSGPWQGHPCRSCRWKASG